MFNDKYSHCSPHFFAVGRHGGRHGFGPGGFRGWGGWGGGDFPGGRKLSSTDLQLLILVLLAERPAHGYELIKNIEDRSGGFYAPSPGMIYPALTYLNEIGHATVEADGARKLYSITAEGQAYLAANRAVADAILRALTQIGSRMDNVREAFSGFAESETAAGGSGDVRRARHALRDALRQKHHCSPEESRRIAAILDRAVAEILAKPM